MRSWLGLSEAIRDVISAAYSFEKELLSETQRGFFSYVLLLIFEFSIYGVFPFFGEVFLECEGELNLLGYLGDCGRVVVLKLYEILS